ncbi:hypothetical protein BKA62DRAFT_761909 [Auriculariales sp. MPI-PUGE-AT-0066]|nr:hypothetical protein BKA62DRAFT_761909 [Auriculariales sp. MPI-PUGE-AT-0066]
MKFSTAPALVVLSQLLGVLAVTQVRSPQVQLVLDYLGAFAAADFSALKDTLTELRLTEALQDFLYTPLPKSLNQPQLNKAQFVATSQSARAELVAIKTHVNQTTEQPGQTVLFLESVGNTVDNRVYNNQVMLTAQIKLVAGRLKIKRVEEVARYSGYTLAKKNGESRIRVSPSNLRVNIPPPASPCGAKSVESPSEQLHLVLDVFEDYAVGDFNVFGQLFAESSQLDVKVTVEQPGRLLIFVRTATRQSLQEEKRIKTSVSTYESFETDLVQLFDFIRDGPSGKLLITHITEFHDSVTMAKFAVALQTAAMAAHQASA